MDKKNCINCDNVLTGDYCSSCGQHVSVKRITLKSLTGEYLGRLFGMDSKFLRTAKDLTLSPGVVARTYIEGNRVKYMGPVAYFFIISTLFILSFSILGVEIREYMLESGAEYGTSLSSETPTGKQLALMDTLMTILSENMKVLNFMIIPFFGIAGRIFYRKSGFNALEHSVNGFYIFGQTTILTILGVVLFKYTGYISTFVLSILFIPYYMWVTVKFYEKKGFWQWAKTLLVYIVSYFMFLVALMIIIFGGLKLYIKFINPKFLG